MKRASRAASPHDSVHLPWQLCMQRHRIDWCAQDKAANAISQLVNLAETLGKLGQEHAEQVPACEW